MGTSATPSRPRAVSRDRVFDNARGAARRVDGRGLQRARRASHTVREEQYDLLTAALLGLVIGVGTALLVRRGPSGRRPIAPMLMRAARGAKWAGLGAARLGRRGAVWARDTGGELWDRVPRDEIRRHVRDYVGRAQEAVDDVVETELRDLRRALRRQRERLGF